MKYASLLSLPLGKLLQALSEMAPELRACLLFCITAFIAGADCAPVEAKTEAAPTPSPPAFRSTAPASVEEAIPADTKNIKDKQHEIIIEKNLFSPDRKKWVSEPKSGKKAADKQPVKEINDLMLLGTVISGPTRYAVIRTKKNITKTAFQPYMKGDYIQGYLVKEIKQKKVILLDETENSKYTLYIDNDKKERVAEKTASKPAVNPAPQKAVRAGTKKPSSSARRTRRTPPKQSPKAP